jgi:hypothetical protein
MTAEKILAVPQARRICCSVAPEIFKIPRYRGI